jgi:biotin operon repressor
VTVSTECRLAAPSRDFTLKSRAYSEAGQTGSNGRQRPAVILFKCTVRVSHCNPDGTLTIISKGIGKTQQRILDALADAPSPDFYMTVRQLASRIGCSDNQIRRAVRSLESRGLVISMREALGHRGVGEYGPLREKNERDAAHPTSLTVKAGEPFPAELRRSGWVATVDTEYYRAGMPTHGLVIASPHREIMSYMKRFEYQGHTLKDSQRTKLRQLVGGCQLSDEDRTLLDHMAPEAFEADG